MTNFSQKITNIRERLQRAVTPPDPEEMLLPLFDDGTLVDLFISRTVGYALHDDRYVTDWLSEKLAHLRLHAEPVSLHQTESWHIDPVTGNISHETGRFFTIMGLKVRHRQGNTEIEWDQPIIDQPEVGILGILAKPINGILHFCLQAKEEPGNLNGVQLSPTVQATYSNYTLVHGGSPPPFLDFFLAPSPGSLLFAKLQTEDGGRFLFKSNRNMIVKVKEHDVPELPDGFIWLTLNQIDRLLQRDNLVNACTRSILSSLLLPAGRTRVMRRLLHELLPETPPPPDARREDAPGHESTLSEILQWMDDQKAMNHFLVKREGLNDLGEWRMDHNGFFSHRDGRFFRIIGINVTSPGREVTIWSQPILDNPEPGIIGLLMKNNGGQRYFLMEAKMEVGNRSIVQLGPTIQFTPGNYSENPKLKKPYLYEEFSGKGTLPLIGESRQAEEGARFYREEHLHRILLLPEGSSLDIPPEFHWLSEDQLCFFLHLGEYVNSCARSILSCAIHDV